MAYVEPMKEFLSTVTLMKGARGIPLSTMFKISGQSYIFNRHELDGIYGCNPASVYVSDGLNIADFVEQIIRESNILRCFLAKYAKASLIEKKSNFEVYSKSSGWLNFGTT